MRGHVDSQKKIAKLKRPILFKSSGNDNTGNFFVILGIEQRSTFFQLLLAVAEVVLVG